jgi:hypothetical protein
MNAGNQTFARYSFGHYERSEVSPGLFFNVKFVEILFFITFQVEHFNGIIRLLRFARNDNQYFLFLC